MERYLSEPKAVVDVYVHHGTRNEALHRIAITNHDASQSDGGGEELTMQLATYKSEMIANPI